MKTTVIVRQEDSAGYALRAIPLAEQLRVTELVELFLEADFKKQQKILTKLRK